MVDHETDYGGLHFVQMPSAPDVSPLPFSSMCAGSLPISLRPEVADRVGKDGGRDVKASRRR